MLKTWGIAAIMALSATVAHADLLEVSGFGGYTSVGMKQVNNMLNYPKGATGVDQSTTDTLSNGYLAGLDIRSGALIPIPFMELGVRAEYIGVNTGEIGGTAAYGAIPYNVKIDPSMADAMLGLSFGTDIPGTGLGVGLGAYGGYGYGLMRVSSNSPIYAPDLYNGEGFVGELEARVRYQLFSVVHLYAFGGWRWANLGTFSDSAGQKFGQGYPGGTPSVDFSGMTGGLGINIDL